MYLVGGDAHAIGRNWAQKRSGAGAYLFSYTPTHPTPYDHTQTVAKIESLEVKIEEHMMSLKARTYKAPMRLCGRGEISYNTDSESARAARLIVGGRCWVGGAWGLQTQNVRREVESVRRLVWECGLTAW